MYTVITEIEAVINSRPLTYLCSEVKEGTPLTPSHFLYGKRLLTLAYSSKQRIEDPDFLGDGSKKKIEKIYQMINANLKLFGCAGRKSI